MHITSGGSAAGTVPAQWTQTIGLLAPAWISELYLGNHSPDGEAALAKMQRESEPAPQSSMTTPPPSTTRRREHL
jgi:hypothetical protein